jgi:NhaP-type Na+/H+ or K+/H+ antiporter
MELLIVIVLGLLVIAGASLLGPKFGVAAPLVLVLVGIGVSFLPFVPEFTLDPEWILAGILPPLLYSASVSMPAMNFRREFGAISGLSVTLVIISALVLGFFFAWAIPGLDLAWGIALGAIVSPTDAVATSILKSTPASPRVVAILEGESLLNDATALVLLRTAIAGAAAAFSFWGAVGDFLFAVAVAAVIGFVVARLNLLLRARVGNATVNTVISFTVPFLASIPAELLGASGLVAAVVAGLVTGRRAPRVLSPQHRLSDSQNWRTVELVLEGVVFLTMGLGIASVIAEVNKNHEGIGPALIIAVAALVITVAVRAAYVAPLLAGLQRRASRSELMKPRLTQMQHHLDSPGAAEVPLAFDAQGVAQRRPRSIVPRDIDARRVTQQRPRTRVPRDIGAIAARVRRGLADIDYLLLAPLGWKEGTIVVWAGMRGAVTVAAAQTLPEGTPSRSLLILIAYVVATLSLVLQGGTLASVIAWLKPATPDEATDRNERGRILDLLVTVAIDTPVEGRTAKQQALALIAAKRTALLDARDDGTFNAETLEAVLVSLDAEQMSIESQGDPRE